MRFDSTSTYDGDVDAILGIAVFDANGLPKEYFITPGHRDTAWVQLVFQSLGLQTLMTHTLGLTGFNYTIVQTRVGNAIVIHTSEQHLALLVKRTYPQNQMAVDDAWIQWVCDFEANTLRQHPHFREA
jgi:hypothetical protein